MERWSRFTQVTSWAAAMILFIVAYRIFGDSGVWLVVFALGIGGMMGQNSIE